MKPKAQTLQQRMGFADPDLATPQHDALMLQLDQRMEEIVLELLGPAKVEVWESTRSGQGDNFWRDNSLFWITDVYRELAADCIEPNYTIKKTWECTITTGNDYTVGFADMRVDVSAPTISIEADYLSGRYGGYANVADIDIAVTDVYVHRPDEVATLYFEVKPTIRSVGEVIRQIRHYQQYRKGTWIVASPDTRYRSIIEEQRIRFVELYEVTL